MGDDTGGLRSLPTRLASWGRSLAFAGPLAAQGQEMGADTGGLRSLPTPLAAQGQENACSIA